jgi:hypothetical protein
LHCTSSQGRDWCAFFMFDNITDSLLGAALKKGGVLFRAENRIQDQAADLDVPERVEESKKDLIRRWSIRDADRVLAAAGREAWVRVYPTPFGLRANEVSIIPVEEGLGKIYGEGSGQEGRARIIDIRSKERNG